MLAITKVGFLGNGKVNFITYGLEIHTHLNLPYVDVRNIKQGGVKQSMSVKQYVWKYNYRLAKPRSHS